jgi:hypothetical protein
MALGSSSNQWDLRLPWGGNTTWDIQLWTGDDGTDPFPPGSHTFEYVVKAAPADTSPIIKITSDHAGSPTPAGAGEITIAGNSLLTTLTLALYPPASQALTPPGTWFHALWMDYADPEFATNLFWGQWMLDPAIQP